MSADGRPGRRSHPVRCGRVAATAGSATTDDEDGGAGGSEGGNVSEDEPNTEASDQLSGWFLDPTALAEQGRRAEIVTGLTVLAPAPDSSTAATVATIARTLDGVFRLDVVAAGASADTWGQDLAAGFDELGLRHRIVTTDADGPTALAAAASVASGEFALILRGELPDLEQLVPGLLRVWIDGGDALVLPVSGSVPEVGPAAVAPEVVSGHVVELLGLRSDGARGALVIRRWLVQRLTEGLGEVDDPAAAVLDRLHRVGATLVELVTGTG